ncbi:hypothetical protein [Methylobacterium sp. A54F]
MDDRRAKLLASQADAQAAKAEFVSQYARGRPGRAVGLGVNRTGDRWTMKVFVEDPDAARGLPKQFRNFDVDVEVTGPVEAY